MGVAPSSLLSLLFFFLLFFLPSLFPVGLALLSVCKHAYVALSRSIDGNPSGKVKKENLIKSLDQI